MQFICIQEIKARIGQNRDLSLGHPHPLRVTKLVVTRVSLSGSLNIYMKWKRSDRRVKETYNRQAWMLGCLWGGGIPWLKFLYQITAEQEPEPVGLSVFLVCQHQYVIRTP